MTSFSFSQSDILVVKIGGGAGLDLARCLDDIAHLAKARPVVVVHGVSDRMNRLCQERGVAIRTLVSPNGHESRYTDSQTRDVFVEAVQQVSAEIVTGLSQRGILAQGVMNAIQGERKTAIRAMMNGRVVMIRDDYSGTINAVEASPLLDVLAQGIVPIVPPIAISPDGYLNVDGDRASASLAGMLSASELVILSNVRGLYRAYPDESSLIPRVQRPELSQALDWAQGRMKRKVLGAQEAILGGVRRVVIADGRATQPIFNALNGSGTEFLA